MTAGDFPKRKFSPGRGELKIRLAISLAGLAFLAFALVASGKPQCLAAFELLIFGGLFFLGSVLWCLRKLIIKDHT